MKKIMIAALLSLLLSHQASAKDGDLKAEGTLEQLTNTLAVVSGESYSVTLTTQFEDSNGNKISSSLFTVGSRVEVKYQLLSGLKVVREMELQTRAATPTPSSSPTPGPSPTPGGSSDRRTTVRLSDDDSSATVKIELRRTGESKFKVQLNIPITKDEVVQKRSAFASNNVTAALSKDGVAYSLCTFKFDGIEVENKRRKAEYKLEIKTNKQGSRIVKGSKGSCDIDLVTEGVQRGLPGVQEGDTILVESTDPVLSIEGTIQ